MCLKRRSGSDPERVALQEWPECNLLPNSIMTGICQTQTMSWRYMLEVTGLPCAFKPSVGSTTLPSSVDETADLSLDLWTIDLFSLQIRSTNFKKYALDESIGILEKEARKELKTVQVMLSPASKEVNIIYSSLLVTPEFLIVSWTYTPCDRADPSVLRYQY